MDNITEIFSDVVKNWRAADSQRMIFGVDMPQTQRAIEALSQSLPKVFNVFPQFSLIQTDQSMEIVVQTDRTAGGPSSLAHVPINLPLLPKIFTGLKIACLTLSTGASGKELDALFKGLSAKTEDIEKQGGLKGFLQSQGVVHIKVDQMKFFLLKEGEQVAEKDEKTSAASADIKNLHDSIWKDYLSEKINADDFMNQHQDFIKMAIDQPKQLEQILKRMMSKQKEAESFLAHLEQKLFQAGFPESAVAALKKKLLKPKKVMVSEDELARLKKIEKEYRKRIDQRMDNTLETIKVIKRKLTDETERSEAILHQMSQGGVVLNKQGNIVSVNVTAQNILGISEKESLGKNINDVLKKHHLLTAVADWQNETDVHTPKEVKVQAFDDETLSIIRESAIVIENEDGRSVGVISALQNVIQQEELNKRKNDILDVLGHDLRAPLGAIKQNFDVLMAGGNFQEKDSDQQKKFVNNCKSNIERMSRLIEKILDMRQLETGKILLKYDTIQTNALIEQAVNSLTDWARNKNIKLDINADQLPHIDGDPERLYQVLTNLVSNALKFTPENGSVITSGGLVENAGTRYVEISVKDSGMGIEKSNLKKIFDKYEQVAQNTPKGVRGLGLGLSICKTIVEMHAGSIWAESELSLGSTFTFQIPVTRR